eukprot:TRINITY_DN27383_c0_g1_i1.p1 TRINITY_DN27383_c0_g1~~TRINITY_DN27383_c0_g1_i1.p1  ORF type:complete len:293 (+),score=83.56 TRINITY_DN27383_c0_g1_i1:75-953(+)
MQPQHAARPGMVVRIRDLVNAARLNGRFGVIQGIQPSGRVTVRVEDDGAEAGGVFALQARNIVVPAPVRGWCYGCRSGRTLLYGSTGQLKCGVCDGEFVEGTVDRESFEEAAAFVPSSPVEEIPQGMANRQPAFFAFRGPGFQFQAGYGMGMMPGMMMGMTDMGMPGAAGAGGLDTLLHQMFTHAQGEQSNAPPPATDAAIAGMETFAATEAHCVDGATCVICQDGYTPAEDTLARMPCGHVYHADCVTPWLRQNHTCPTCRTPLEEALPRAMSKDTEDAPETPAARAVTEP